MFSNPSRFLITSDAMVWYWWQPWENGNNVVEVLRPDPLGPSPCSLDPFLKKIIPNYGESISPPSLSGDWCSTLIWITSLLSPLNISVALLKVWLNPYWWNVLDGHCYVARHFWFYSDYICSTNLVFSDLSICSNCPHNRHTSYYT